MLNPEPQISHVGGFQIDWRWKLVLTTTVAQSDHPTSHHDRFWTPFSVPRVTTCQVAGRDRDRLVIRAKHE